ncbi:hypothetical protein L3X38_003122 [Prunus dulcis]|uniref:RNase H type-1 domain-containing protein n=1 Tax=Prunus dulcis TaxID=3755 RepID=A0AAD4WWH2_PRUDU|nr:hypothetical protein L3X38_003122 [Prunus dulcis]
MENNSGHQKSWGMRVGMSIRLLGRRRWQIALSASEQVRACEMKGVEFTPSAEEEKLVSKKKESPRADKTSAEPGQPKDMWQLRVDGVSNQKGAEAGVVIVTPDGTLLKQAITLSFPASNNEVEYEALLAALRLARELSIKKLAIYSDS